MEIVLFLWLAGIVNGLGLLSVSIGLIGGVILLFLAFVFAGGHDSIQLWTQLWWKVGLAFCFCAIIFSAILPNKNTLYLMAGGYYGQKALQSDTAQKVLTIVNGHLDEQIQKLTK